MTVFQSLRFRALTRNPFLSNGLIWRRPAWNTEHSSRESLASMIVAFDKAQLELDLWPLNLVAFFILHRAHHCAFRVFKEDQCAHRWDLELGHDDLSAVPFNGRDRVTD